MSSSKEIILAFDAYGTLLSTESIADRLSTHFAAEKAKSITTKWRLYQLEYTWRLNSMQQYIPFSTVTRHSLQHALKEAGVSLQVAEIDTLMQSYDSLSTFPDVASCLSAISDAPDVTAFVFSNGTYDMVASSIRNSPELMPHASVFKEIVVVEEVKRFKPDPAVYRYLCKKAGKEGREGDVWLISGNPFDIVGARAVGWNAVWVDRAGNGWVDSCVEGEVGRPSVIVRSLKEVLTAVSEHRET